MDHVDAVLESDPDDIVLRKIRTDRSQTSPNLVCFIGLSDTLGSPHRLSSDIAPSGDEQRDDPRTNR